MGFAVWGIGLGSGGVATEKKSEYIKIRKKKKCNGTSIALVKKRDILKIKV